MAKALHFQRLVSADSHVREPVDLWWNAVGGKFGDRTPRLIHEHLGQKGRFFFTGRYVTPIGEIEAGQTARFGSALEPTGYLPEARVKFQEDAGLAAEIMNPTTLLNIMHMRAEDGDVVRAAAQVYNDWIAEFSSYNPKRLVGIGAIPMDDIGWAVRELKRITQKGLMSAIINIEPPEGRPLYRDRAYDPFWAAAEDMGTPITLHIITGRVPDPLLHFNTPKEHEETPRAMLAVWNEIQGVLANEFIFGGILDRFPNLKLTCSEYEVSWIPSFMFRIDQMQHDFASRLPLAKLKMAASDYVRTRIWHGIVDDPYCRDSIPHVGADQILWGSDFPHIRSIGLDAQEAVAKMFHGLPRADQEKIAGGNAAKVYGL